MRVTNDYAILLRGCFKIGETVKLKINPDKKVIITGIMLTYCHIKYLANDGNTSDYYLPFEFEDDESNRLNAD